MSKNITPRWQNPNKPIVPKTVDPAATPVKVKPKSGRDYIGDAVTALAGLKADIKAGVTTVTQNQSLLAAIIVAQAIDRFGEKLIEAAAVSQYKRAP